MRGAPALLRPITGAALPVGVDEQHLVPGTGAQPGEIGRQRGFPCPAFFAQDRDNHPPVSTASMGIEITRYLSHSLAYTPCIGWKQAPISRQLVALRA